MRRFYWFLLLNALKAAAAHAVDPNAIAFRADVQPLLNTYCFKCHGGEKVKGDVSLAPFNDDGAVQTDPKLWRNVLTQVSDYTMPPKKQTQPTAAERELLVGYITHRLNHLDLSKIKKDPGRVTIHRLNRQEYNNTLRDLLGIDSRPAETFPADGGGGGGFDNNADTLFVPPILMEMYLKAAGDAIAAADVGRLVAVKPGAGKSNREAARENLERFAGRAFRRPVEPREIERYFNLSDQAEQRGATFESALKLGYKAILISPNFLFRVEKDQPTKEPYAISDFELASRLSYFIWSSMPDDELLKLARENRLHEDAVIDAQVRRMLKDPKSKAVSEYFGGQWLGVNALMTTAMPDRERFPKYTSQIRDSMYLQSIEFIDSIFRDDRSILTLLDSDYTYLNQPLAALYELPKIKGEELRRVSLEGPAKIRGGILGLGAVHVITSYPLRTSPVLRGKWILETVLGAPPPAPPPDVPKLAEDDSPAGVLTLRQRLEKHRADAACASCHSRMDPLGFGLENFDPIGRWRADLSGHPIDAVGTLTTGESFSGPAELKKILLNKKEEFVRTLTGKLLAYALGRGLEFYDEPTIKNITDQLGACGYKSTVLVAEIAKSYPFRYRRN
jgi:hypothetical protein